MDHLIPAIFESGVFLPVELAEGTPVHIQIPKLTPSNQVESTELQDEREQRVVALARNCRVSLSDSSRGSDGLCE